MKPIKVLSYNIHKGVGMRSKTLTIQGIKEAVEQSGANILFLQEIVGENRKSRERFPHWPDASQFEYLADKMWPHYAYGKNAIYFGGNHGNAILSQFPIVFSETTCISTNPFEKRGILHAKILVPEKDGGEPKDEIELFCLHLDLFHRGRKRQYQWIKEYMLAEANLLSPMIVAGDFNDWNQKSRDVFEAQFGMTEVFHHLNGNYAKTFPSPMPVLPLDRLYVRNFDILNAEIGDKMQWRKLSDHLPIMAEIRPSEKKTIDHALPLLLANRAG